VIRADLNGLYVAIPSRGRPKNVPLMEAMVGKATWYVDPEQEAEYQAEGAHTVAVPVRGHVAARNAALDDSFRLGAPCLQLDDDLKSVKRILGKKEKQEVPFIEAINEMYFGLTNSPFRLAGAAPTDNPFFFNPEEPCKTKAFIWGACMIILPTPLRFDPLIVVKDDYDYTCAHVKEYGGVYRTDFFTFKFAYKTNKGGAQDYRTEAIQRNDIFRLRCKWGGWIRANPKRPLEILLHF
jgi:hypothetical protein